MDDEVTLVVAGMRNGGRFGGWKTVRVTRSIESLAGSFTLGVSDRWDGAKEPWAIAEGDRCRVEIDDRVVIDGYVDRRDLSSSKEERSLSFTGRDRSASLVDSSLLLSSWTFRNMTLHEFATEIAKPFRVRVSLQNGLVLPRRAKIVVQPGDKGYDALAREAAEDGVLIVSDGAGGVIITRSGRARATSLVEGQNILSASVSYDGTDRYHRYVVATQAAATDTAAGDATRVQAQQIDEGVARTDRVLLIRPEKGYTVADAKRRADWEARVRAARAETVTVVVQGWKQPDGALWPLNALTRVRASRLVGVNGDMLITQVEHSISDQEGKVTQLRLMRPDAFTPEPKAIKPTSGPGGWKELKDGAK